MFQFFLTLKGKSLLLKFVFVLNLHVLINISHLALTGYCLRVLQGAPAQEICRVVLQKSVYSPGAFQLGANKVFLKEALEKTLEQERFKKLSSSVVTVQKCVRGYLARRR